MAAAPEVSAAPTPETSSSASAPATSSTSPASAGNRSGGSPRSVDTSDERADDGNDSAGNDSAGNDSDAVAGDDTGGSDGPALGPDGQPRRRRRRGSRGGRNRKRPATAGGPGSAATGANATSEHASDDDDDDFDDDEARLPQSQFDAAADRGLTTEDVAEAAMEDAGVVHTPRTRVGDSRPASVAEGEPEKPKIGDSRPAPAGGVAPGAAAASAAGGAAASTGEGGTAKRRRRRGGRGRGRSGQGTGGANQNSPQVQSGANGRNGRDGGNGQSGNRGSRSAEVVRADLGVGEEPSAPLDEDVLERRRGRTRKGRPAGRYMMCVHTNPTGHTHIAILEGRNLVEHSLASPAGNDSIDGNIYLGRVQNVLPGMEAAFIDIGTPKNGVLYRGDVAFDKSDVEGGGKPKIERMLKNGQMILVQVTKNPIAHKGARLTQEVSLAGRFLVMVPGEPDTYGISKRLPDDERKRLRRILDEIRPTDAGLIVRTAAEGATRDELERDVRRLRNQWEQISQVAAGAKSAKLVYQEPDLVLRLIREEFTKEYRGIAIDDALLYEETRGYVEAIAPELAERVELYDTEAEGLPVFERFHVSEQLLKALDRKVWLPSGGSLIIERTEALTVIDVNTGKNVGKSNLEETVFRNNLEAAEEIARQLRLRDIGGIIVIDFIDMEIKANRDEVMRVFRDALARDKTRTQAFEMSELGLVEMTRKRISEGLVESFSDTCPTCHGRGLLLDEALLRAMD
jgi:ribonuclease E